MLDQSKKDNVVINVNNIINARELHELLKSNLDFPDFYGMNWDAFWDAITGLVELPNSITFEGWKHLKKLLPKDTQIISDMFSDMNKMYSTFRCEVNYN